MKRRAWTQWLKLCILAVGLAFLFFSIYIGIFPQRHTDPYAGKTPEQIVAIARQMLASPDASPGDRIYLLNRLGRIHTDEATDILRQTALHQPPPVNKIAATDLFGRDDMTALSVLKDDLEKSSRFQSGLEPMTTNVPADGMTRVMGVDMTINLGAYLDRVRDPQAIPTLIQLMSSTAPEIRQGAAAALLEIFSPRHHGDPPLPKSIDPAPVTRAFIAGLNDSDETVRYYSVCALMDANGDPHSPSIELFKANESDYISRWKDWARNGQQPTP